MFLGVVPDGCITQIIRTVDFRLWPDIHVCCSGTFRFERAILEVHPNARLISNDVSVFSVPLGRYALGVETPLRYVKKLAFLEDILADRPYVDRLAALLVASDYAKWKSGKPNRFKDSHARHYEANFRDMVLATSQKLQKTIAKVAIKDFFAGDWLKHIDHAIEKGAGVVAFPPFWKCLAPEHRMLTADMRWVPCGDLKVGDRLLAFDEYPVDGNRLRRWRYATVTHSEPARRECVRVHLENGDTVVCTADHPWLVAGMGTRPAGDGGWMEAKDLCRMSRMPTRDNHEIKATVLKAFHHWEAARTFEDGWMSGILDGEGTLSMPSGPKGHGSSKVCIAQAAGLVSDKIQEMLHRHGFGFSINVREPHDWHRKTLHQITVHGGFQEVARLLGVFQPARLINRLMNEVDVSLQSVRVNDGEGASKVRVIGVEPLGMREIQSISTSTGTYVGEGYLMHNSGYEKQFQFLNENITWDAPSYEIWDPKGLKGVVDRVAESGIPYCILSDQILEGHERVIEYADGTHKVHYCYASTNHASYRQYVRSGSPFKYMPLDLSKLKEKSKVAIVEATSDQMNFLKDTYLKKSIQHTTGVANFLVYIDGMLAGGIIYALSKYGAHDCLYLLSDFSTTQKGRISKLIAKIALSREIIGPLEKRYLWKFRKVFTTAFTHKPVSMKYRGVMEIVSRKPAEDPRLGNMINYEGDVLDDTVQQIYAWWWRHRVPTAAVER
jgi:hypothetical protein